MAFFPPEFLDLLRSRLRLSDIVGKTVRLRSQTRGEFTGLCPFHQEKTPSFTVSDVKGFYHCFGCGAHGDAIGFTMESERIPYPEAIAKLADYAGLPLPKMREEKPEVVEQRQRNQSVAEAACLWFEAQLHTKAGAQAREYLAHRGLTIETQKQFRLGFAPDDRQGLRKALLAQGFTDAAMIEAGLLIKPDNYRSTDQGSASEGSREGVRPSQSTEPYSRFRGRIMFPIQDLKGKVIAFGGRILGAGEPKYLNSPETPLFKKGQQLYNYHRALQAGRKAGQLVVVEGYMDVIALAQAGIAYAVAPLGTAVTPDQIHLLWSAVPEPVFCLDGDAAGTRAMYKAADLALPLLVSGRSLRFVTLPKGEDPDSLVQRHGVDAMHTLLSQAEPLSELLWRKEYKAAIPTTPERMAAFKRHLNKLCLSIPDKTLMESYRDFFRSKLREATRPNYNKGQKSVVLPVTPQPKKPSSTLSEQAQLECRILALALHHPRLLSESHAAEELSQLELTYQKLDRLRGFILENLASQPGEHAITAQTLPSHLEKTGITTDIQFVSRHAMMDRLMKPDTPFELAQTGWKFLIMQHQLLSARQTYQRLSGNAQSVEQLEKVQALKTQIDAMEHSVQDAAMELAEYDT